MSDQDARLSNFEAERVFENDWTNASLDLLEGLHKQCKDNSSAYADAARVARWKHRAVSIPTIVVASFATATSFFSAGSSCDDDEENTAVKISVAILTSITAILGGVSALYSFDSKTTACIAASGNFDALAKKAQLQIFLSNQLRGPVEVVLTEISAEFCHLTNTSPLL
ncbi:unknown [Feldmannia species virus]|uniref:Uncharacterized protein n=1 Tax=Feldmannia species virus TaxID=39420 RepID=B5LWK0_9PHYC|nr:hypothetical protein FeldSpV_gp111 [Feldmannia species virus]ACH46863.1 unknown [Feldmannia species virus]